MSLTRYITRRKYTILLLRMSEECFKNLTIHKQYYGIKEFKRKCLHEFPTLKNNYAPEYMQVPIVEPVLRTLLDEQIAKKSKEYLMKSLYEDITKGRTPFEVKTPTQDIILQSSTDILVNLEKTYFIFEDKFFIITATLNIVQNQIEDPFLSMLFNQPVYPSYNLPTDANSILHILHQYLKGSSTTSNGFSISLEYVYKDGWGTSALISSMSFDNDTLQDIKFADNPFLSFDNQNITLDLSFFKKSHPE